MNVMTGLGAQSPERRRLLIAMPLLCGALTCISPFAGAHNNPDFKEVLLLTVAVSAEPITERPFPAYSEPFALDLPKKTIELVWRLADGTGDEIAFDIAQGGALHAEGLTDGATSRILRGGDIRIVNLDGASGPFSIDVYANVIDRGESGES